MNRRHFITCPAAALALVGAPWANGRSPLPTAEAFTARCHEIEEGLGGRLGVAIIDTGPTTLIGHRLDERFPMCSTFKWLAAAHVLDRVDRHQERLDRRIHYGRDALLPHSPQTAPHADGAGMTLAELCAATITVSDNAAANLILGTYGGPTGLTRYLRRLGDTVTRLDRTEPALNESAPSDPRDTTTPRAMGHLLSRTLLGNALTPASRLQLIAWMQATRTNANRLAADLPEGWRVGSKTGTGERGSTGDVGVYWPPNASPRVVVAYIASTAAALPRREAAIAEIGAAARQRLR